MVVVVVVAVVVVAVDLARGFAVSESLQKKTGKPNRISTLKSVSKNKQISKLKRIVKREGQKEKTHINKQ